LPLTKSLSNQKLFQNLLTFINFRCNFCTWCSVSKFYSFLFKSNLECNCWTSELLES